MTKHILRACLWLVLLLAAFATLALWLMEANQ
jgi:hypothetical protein